jgi:methylglyoxal synthase
MQRRPRIAFITTPKYREHHAGLIDTFVYRHLYSLCDAFEVLCTGRTYNDHLLKILDRPLDQVDTRSIESDMHITIDNEDALNRWRSGVRKGLTELLPGIQGMIELTYELVEGRLDAVLHLTDWEDIAGKPDSMVLRREANVHNVPIASDIHTARSFVTTWKSRLARAKTNESIFPQKRAVDYQSPLTHLTENDRVLALIAHDGMKLEMCRFVIEYASEIFNDYDYILATGTTGMWLKQFILAANRSQHDADKIRCCLSGPKGGDVQIAAAVVKRICRKVIFLQDPFTSHPHETDIRLFEQSVLLFERASQNTNIEIELATNVESAKSILGV